MAGDWIKMRCDLADDPAVIAIAAATGLDEFGVVGRLHRLWVWADGQTTDGYAVNVTDSWIDRHVCCAGFAEAMIEPGWLKLTSGGVVFPNFERHNGQTSKRRALTSRRMAKMRGKKSDAAVVTKTSPEKRREENIDSSKDESLAASARSGLLFPLSTGNVWELPGRKLAEYLATYGDQFDVRRELEKARLWLADKKDRRSRTGSATQRRLTSWLARTSDRCAKTIPGSPVAAVPSGGDVVFNPETGEIVKPMR